MIAGEGLETISGRELAKRLGVTETSVRKARDNGRITSIGDGGKYLWPAASDEFKANRDLAKVRDDSMLDSVTEPATAEKNESRRGSRERMEKAKADLAEMELAKRMGELVPVTSVERQARKVAVVVKQQLMAIPDRVCADLAVDMDPNSIKIKLDTELRKVLEAVSFETEHIR